MSKIIVRNADHNDSIDIFRWRNDELSREMSINSDVIRWECHQKWFDSINENALVLICELSSINQSVGMVRFDFDDAGKRARVSINLAQEYRGKGYAKRCLLSALDVVHTEKPIFLEIYAEIKAINIVSQKLFHDIGFKKVSVNEHGYFVYSLKLSDRIN